MSALPPAMLTSIYRKSLQIKGCATNLMLNAFTAGLINEETLFYRHTVAVTRHCEASSPKQSLTRNSSERLPRFARNDKR
jgi:hypothetical protein